MAVDYAEKEREFLDSLQQDTGRDLAQWMSAIAATGLTDRNAIIDWLRQQGFLFARASWMERIHHNGGRPIYLDAAALGGASPPVAKPTTPVVPARAPVEPVPPPLPVPDPVREVVSPAPPTARAAPPVTDGLTLDAVLAEAKGYRPLAVLVLKEIEKAAPGAVLLPREGGVAILTANAAVAGVLTLTAKELRLALALGTRAVLPPFSKPKFPKPHPDLSGPFTHMIVLTDARQVTPDLLTAVADAVAGA
jgi:hypothetical protein